MIPRFNELVSEVHKNLEFFKAYGVPYDPQPIGFEQEKPADYKEQLNLLQEAVACCEDCPLGSDRIRRKAKSVPGGGNPDALVMIVGEGPGKMEERYKGSESSYEYGFPFVGPSGDELNRIIKFLKLKREDLFITNTVRCRATEKNGFEVKDRQPSITEIDACQPFLIKQIELVQPWIIIAAGKPAACSLLKLGLHTPVSELKDKLHNYPRDPRIKVWPTWHPAFLLRNREEMIPTGLGLKHLKAILHKSLPKD